MKTKWPEKKTKAKELENYKPQIQKLKTLRAFKNPKNLGPGKIIGPKNT